ncbi:MAG: hypothetical protein LGB73_02465, partial [Sulfurovum sp.]|nr:hypothetical protein [Sulfurovum sp.]
MKLYLQGLAVAIIAIVILDSCGVNTNRATVGNKGTLCNVVHNNTRYGCVESKNTGRIWLDRNLGAQKVAESVWDLAAIGWYYQWGRETDGHQFINSPVTEERSATVF